MKARGRCGREGRVRRGGRRIDYLVGTMIELPRAADGRRDRREGEFFSFGTNDLTQTTLGISRDDAGRFLTPMSRRASSSAIPSSPRPSTASANWSRWRRARPATRAPASSSASAANMAAIRPRSPSASASASITCPARPSACRSRGWRRRRRQKGGRALVLTRLDSEVALPDRTATGIAEFDRALGGGWLRGSATLIGGDPGIGKSTLLLQTAAMMARAGHRCRLYQRRGGGGSGAAARRRLGLGDAPVRLAGGDLGARHIDHAGQGAGRRICW
jgi:hypothetical protein